MMLKIIVSKTQFRSLKALSRAINFIAFNLKYCRVLMAAIAILEFFCNFAGMNTAYISGVFLICAFAVHNNIF